MKTTKQISMLLLATFCLFMLNACKKDCNCSAVPEHFYLDAEQLDGYLFKWISTSNASSYVITITDLENKQTITDAFTINASDPTQRKVFKAKNEAFFINGHAYSATIRRDCSKLKGCKDGSSVESEAVFFIQKSGAVNANFRMNRIDPCSFEFGCNVIAGANKYLLYTYDVTDKKLYVEDADGIQTGSYKATVPYINTHQYLSWGVARTIEHENEPTAMITTIGYCCVIIVEDDLEATGVVFDTTKVLTTINNCNISACQVSAANNVRIVTSDADGAIVVSWPQMRLCTPNYKIVLRPVNATSLDEWFQTQCMPRTRSIDDVHFQYMGPEIIPNTDYYVILVPIGRTCLRCQRF